jgi:hypothetical protein
MYEAVVHYTVQQEEQSKWTESLTLRNTVSM